MSQQITDKELEELRAEQEKYMPEEFIIRRKENIGGDEFEWSNVATEVSGRKSPGFGTFREIADRFQGITPYTFTMPWNQDVVPGDQVIAEDDTIYEVRFVQDRGSYTTAVRFLTDRFH